MKEYLYIKEDMREQFIKEAESWGFEKIEMANPNNWEIEFYEYDAILEVNEFFCYDRVYDYEIKKTINLAVVMFDLFNNGYVAKGVRE